MNKYDVSVNINNNLTYCKNSPFLPPEHFPELDQIVINEIDPTNTIYRHIRQCIYEMGLDQENFGTTNWNPFGEFINKGNRVLIKPNLVLHFSGSSSNIDALVTHGSVVRPLIDYALIALNGTGEVLIGDAPHGNADFNKIIESNGLKRLVQWYQQLGLPVSIIDFRKFIYDTGPQGFVNGILKDVSQDPNGYILVDLKDKSFLNNLGNIERLYGSDYDRHFIVKNHSSCHRYLVSGSVLKADVIISVPKMKTHKKTGITLNLKNLVGINGDKNYLAHYRIGSPSQGGDEYPDSNSIILGIIRYWDRWSKDVLLSKNSKKLRLIYKMVNKPFYVLRRFYQKMTHKKIIELGDWYRNDTAWRMCLDLNHILLYSDKNGAVCKDMQRKYFSLIDGVIAGEGDGPMEPTPKKIGYIACGNNPFMVDYVSCWQMGFDPQKIKLLKHSMELEKFGFNPDLIKVKCIINGETISYRDTNLQFQPHHAWEGMIER